MVRVVVVGAGIAGLAAAEGLVERLGPDAQVLVLEGTDRVGGKLRGETVAGVRVDVGAEAMLNRRPEGVALARRAGLEVVYPTAATSRLWSYGALRTLPRSLMGVPLDLAGLAASGALSAAGLARVLREPELPKTVVSDDISVGDLVAQRFGDEVSDRLVEPLLGGVYAGHAREISARAAAPQLLRLAEGGSLLRAAAEMTVPPTAPGVSAASVFASVAGGMHRLPQALAESGRFAVRTNVVVRELHRSGPGFRLVVGPVPDPEKILADAVVLATPAAPASRLLAETAPAAAMELARFEAASVAVVSLAFRAEEALGALGEDRSGFLVPPAEGRRIKAATFSYGKWDQVREAGRGAGSRGEDLLLLRTSLGRHREEESLQHTDQRLVEISLAELAAATGLEALPVGSHVQRWGGGLPQYPVGHHHAVARIRAAVARVPGLAVAGASYDGVGIPATIASAQRAVDQVCRGTMSA